LLKKKGRTPDLQARNRLSPDRHASEREICVINLNERAIGAATPDG